MTTTEAFGEIENGSVLAEGWLASTVAALRARLEGHSVVQEVCQRVARCPEETTLLLERAVSVLGATEDESFASMNDVPLAAYSLVLGGIYTSGVQKFLERVAQLNQHRYRFAPALAGELLRARGTITTNMVDPLTTDAEVRRTVHRAQVGSAQVVVNA